MVLALSGCPFGGVTQLNRLPESQALQTPQLFNRPGVLRHEATGFDFSEWYENFQRVTAYRYDTAELNISIGYNDRRPACLVVATFYVYPTPRMSFVGASPSVVASIEEGWLRDEFARSRAEVEAAHPGLRGPSVSSVATPLGGSFVQSPSFRFREADKVSELRLLIYDRQWFLKYRFTYPRSCESVATKRIESLNRQLPWAAA